MTDEYKNLMIARIDKRKEQFLVRHERVKRLIERGKIGGEYNRIWLEEQIKDLKFGLDICCGDMLINGAEGIDIDRTVIGPTWYLSGDALINYVDNELDFIVTNYIEAFPQTINVLNEWRRVLKPGGVLAFTCANAEKYKDKNGGPLINIHRASIFTPITIRQYLVRCDFENIYVEDGEELSMRVRCNKKNEIRK